MSAIWKQCPAGRPMLRMRILLNQNCEFWLTEKGQEFTEHMLDKLLSGHDNKTIQIRRYKNLQHQPRHQISHLHLRNNPYREGHPRSCGECPQMSFRAKHHIYRSFNRWRNAILSAFGYDPLKCECGTTMLFLELYFNHKRVSLQDLYEKAMSRSRGRRSSAWLFQVLFPWYTPCKGGRAYESKHRETTQKIYV